MKLFLFIFSIFIQKIILAQTGYFLGVGTGIGRYTGEIEYNQYLNISPINHTVNPNFYINIGTNFNQKYQLELNLACISYIGKSEYSNPSRLQKMNAEINGNTIVIGTQLSKKLNKDMSLGVGLNYGINQFITQTQTTKTEKNNNNWGISFHIDKLILQTRKKIQWGIRYQILYNLNDNYDSYYRGKTNDFITLGQTYITFPLNHLNQYNRSLKYRFRYQKHCPKF